jgi:hypothetical protein
MARNSGAATHEGRTVLALVRHARQRLFKNELLSQGANAFCAALVAFILLLLVGTMLLDWRWTLLIPLAAAAVGVYLARRRLPSPYVVAQAIDHRLALTDTISTALYFSQKPDARVSPEVRRLQFEEAERVSRTVDVRQAIPYVVPRGLYAALALLLVASSLFALRYGLTKRLGLRPPLANILQETFGGERKQIAKNQKRPNPLQPPESQDENGDAAAQPDPQSGGSPDGDPDAAEEQADAKQPEMATSKKSGDSKSQDGAEKNSAEEQDGQGEDREGSSGENPNSGKESKNADQKQQSGKEGQQQNASDNSSLWNKVKDGFQNLMSRMKQQPNNNPSPQQQANNQDSKQGKGQQNGSKQQNKDGQQQAGNQQGEAQEGEQGEQAENAQDPQGKGQGKSEEKQASKQPGSGIGSQDGSKDIRQAEQLAAMGKITELFGKRSANITGEATVEVQNTVQTLKTPYAQRGVQHTQGGAEISRDEIPVVLQTYVEQYFEEVRKQKK